VALAQNAARRQQRVALLDLDFQNGGCDVALDLDPAVTIQAVLEAPERLDASFLEGSMVKQASGLELLAASRKNIPFDLMTPEVAHAILRYAAQDHSYVLVELPRVSCRWTATVLAASDLIVLVTQLTVPALRQARRELDILATSTAADVAVVVNRYERRWWRNRVRLGEAEHALGRGVDYMVANDYRTVSEALNSGKPLIELRRGARVTRDIVRLSERLQERLKREPAFQTARLR
jgi:pilus assembly protein CpaE